MRIYEINYIDCLEAVEDVSECSMCGTPKGFEPDHRHRFW
jgi:hypothetical protein